MRLRQRCGGRFAFRGKEPNDEPDAKAGAVRRAGMFPPMKRSLAVEWRPVTSITPYARNSRTHSDEQVAQIAASIKEFGWTNPILLDETGGIIAGHGRLLAAQRMGQATVPTITLDGLTDAQRRAYVIADNKLALNAGWDLEMLAVELGELNAEGFDLRRLRGARGLRRCWPKRPRA